MPWEEPPEEASPQPRPRTPMSLAEVPEDVRLLLLVRPVRNPEVEWEEDPRTHRITLVYPKEFTAGERALKRVFRAVEEIRRPLDDPGSDIWRMCDGEHDIADICDRIDEGYKEAMEPVLTRVTDFVEVLADRGLVRLRREPFEAEQEAA